MDPGNILRLILAPIQGAFALAGTAQEHEAETDANYANQAELGRLLRAEQGNAVDVLSRGYLQAGLQRMAASQLLAKQQTAFANSGVLAGVGTPAAVTSASSALAEYSARVAENDALRAALGHKAAADKALRQREQLILQQRARDRALPLKLGADVLNAASAVPRALPGGGQ